MMVKVQTPIPDEIHKIIKIHATATGSKLETILKDALTQYFSHPKFNYCREAIEKAKLPLS